MLPLYEDPHFTFRFADNRILSRFHLEGIPAGRRVSVFKMHPGTREQLGLLTTATVGDNGWVDLKKPILVQAGEGFIVVPELGRLKHSLGKMVLYGIGVVGVLAIAGYFCGLAVHPRAGGEGAGVGGARRSDTVFDRQTQLGLIHGILSAPDEDAPPLGYAD